MSILDCSYWSHWTAEKLVWPCCTYFRKPFEVGIHLRPGPSGMFCIWLHKYIALKSRNNNAVYRSPFGAHLLAAGLSTDVKFISLKYELFSMQHMICCIYKRYANTVILPMKYSAETTNHLVTESFANWSELLLQFLFDFHIVLVVECVDKRQRLIMHFVHGLKSNWW